MRRKKCIRIKLHNKTKDGRKCCIVLKKKVFEKDERFHVLCHNMHPLKKHQISETKNVLLPIRVFKENKLLIKEDGRVALIHRNSSKSHIGSGSLTVLMSQPQKNHHFSHLSLSKHCNKLFSIQPWAHRKTPRGNFEMIFVCDEKKKGETAGWAENVLWSSNKNLRDEFYFFSEN